MARSLATSLLMLCMLAVPACDTVTGEDPELPVETFEMTLTGEGIDQTIMGQSYYFSGTIPETDGVIFMIYFIRESGGEGAPVIGFVGRATPRAGTGTYAVTDVDVTNGGQGVSLDHYLEEDDFVFLMNKTDETTFTVFTSEAGELEISTSREGQVVGTLTIEGVARVSTSEHPDGEPVPVAISGAFNAGLGPFIPY